MSQKTTLIDEQIKNETSMTRRSALGRVAAIAAGAAVVAVGVAPGEAAAQCTDSDGGSNADGAGQGRRCRRCTDSDNGSNADGVGRGRRC